jgi:intergrase/recombinase
LNPGRQRGRLYSIKWLENKAEFIKYLESKHYCSRYVECILSYLDKNVTELCEPMDIVSIFAKLTQGQQHNLNRAIRALLNFMELKGVDNAYLNALRKAIPQDIVGVDLKVPVESEILNSLRLLDKMPLKYKALYSLLLDSGLRLTEAVRLINQFDGATEINSFYRCTLGYFRGSKLAYAAYFSDSSLELLKKNHERVADRTASHYFKKFGYIAPKYLRKFTFDKMIELGVPESVADFIEGRAPRRIGARHYMAICRQADGYYGKYADYLKKLRKYGIEAREQTCTAHVGSV